MPVSRHAITAIKANTGFLDFHRKEDEKSVAGITLDTPTAMPIIVMLSPYDRLFKKKKISGGSPIKLFAQISFFDLPSITDFKR